jgi:hypothetical protein
MWHFSKLESVSFFFFFCLFLDSKTNPKTSENLDSRHPKTRRFMSRQHHLLVVIVCFWIRKRIQKHPRTWTITEFPGTCDPQRLRLHVSPVVPEECGSPGTRFVLLQQNPGIPALACSLLKHVVRGTLHKIQTCFMVPNACKLLQIAVGKMWH